MNLKKILIKLFSVILLIGGLWYLFYGNPFVIYNLDDKKDFKVLNKIEIPNKNVLKNMTIETLLLFNNGFKNKNLEELYNNSSKMIKNMYTLKEFNENYFKSLNINIVSSVPSLKNIKIFSETKVSSKTILLKGYLEKSYKFDMYFYYENNKWKSSGITIYPEFKSK